MLEKFEYLKTKLGTLFLGDNRKILPIMLKEVENKTVKLALTSPPYNIGQQETRNSTFCYGGKSQGEYKKYDTIDDNMDETEYMKWQHSIIISLYTLLSDDGAIFYNHKPRITDGVLDDRKNLVPYNIRQEIVWKKHSMINFNGRFYVPNTERIYIIAKKNWMPHRDCLKFGEVWDMPNTDRNEHPAPFCLALAMRIIESTTNPDDLVIDPFMGSGTTALACEKTGRRWFGIELSETYCEMAKKRINQEYKQLKLFT